MNEILKTHNNNSVSEAYIHWPLRCCSSRTIHWMTLLNAVCIMLHPLSETHYLIQLLKAPLSQFSNVGSKLFCLTFSLPTNPTIASISENMILWHFWNTMMIVIIKNNNSCFKRVGGFQKMFLVVSSWQTTQIVMKSVSVNG